MDKGRHHGRLAIKVLLAVLATVLFLGATELVLRMARFQYTPRERILWMPTVAGFDGTFEYRLQTAFEPPGYIWRTERNTAYTDANGFRNPPLPLRKEPGKIRIAFLGGSTTQGQRHAYPERTIRIMNDALGTNRFEALNVACSAYSTHQSLLALQRWVFDRNPDMVCVYHGWNDLAQADDGYSDAEKDALFGVSQKAGDWKRLLSARFRLVQGLAWLVDSADRSWPRQRVPPARFESNLRSIARLCAQHGKYLVIFTRPPLAQTGRPDDMHEPCVQIQRRVASSESNARLFDASAVVGHLQERMKAGEFGPEVQINQPDASHLRPLGEQLLAEQLALFVAPEHADHIGQYIAGVDYRVATARELLGELMPREAAYYLRNVLAQEPGHPMAQSLLTEAISQFEFEDLFWQGCWGGSDTVYESKLAKLKRCLEMRPSDFGVCMQIANVCFNMDHAGDAADAMANFNPANPTDRYRWYWYTFSSHVAAQRRSQAIRYARLCLELDPNDADARAFLQEAGADTSR